MAKKLFCCLLFVSLCTSLAIGELAGYWKFDEGSGTTTADSSGNGKSGVLTGNGSMPQWVQGHNGTGHALRFNQFATSFSNSNWVNVHITSSDKLANIARIPTQAFTIVMWIKPDGKTPDKKPRYLFNTDSYDFLLAPDPCDMASADGIDFFESYPGWQSVDMDREKDIQRSGEWIHFAITYDGNYLRKYVEGNVSCMTYPPILRSEIPIATSDLMIAAADIPGFEGYFNGIIDEMAIYKGCYLKREEIIKLVEGTATPLTVTTSPVEGLLPVKSWTLESAQGWTEEGWRSVWNPSFNWDVYLSSSSDMRLWDASAWWFQNSLTPGDRSPVWLWGQWFPEKIPTDINDANAYVVGWYDESERMDESKYGVEWVSEAKSGRGDNLAVFAAYITPGYAMVQNDWGFQPYDPSPTRFIPFEDKPYFKTYARFTTENAPPGCSMLVKLYTYDNNDNPDVVWSDVINDPTVLKYYGEVSIPILGGDYKWQEFKGALPKSALVGGTKDFNDPNAGHIAFVITLKGGNPNTRLLVDEFDPISDQYFDNFTNSSTYLEGDLNRDSIVYYSDMKYLADNWLSSVGGVIEPRTGGLLTNGDFYSNYGSLPANVDDINIVHMAPTGWSISGVGNYGIRHSDKAGFVNYANAMMTPMGGSVSVQLTDMLPNDTNGVLEQTTAATAVAGQTYYAMTYVMTPGWSASFDDWRGWKDTATMNVVINGTVKATFTRKLSRNVWRPLYGTYTAVSGDAGKPIKIQISYANTHTDETTDSGLMLVGYAYLNTTKPQEWPEARSNMLVNGGFEDLSNYESGYSSIVQSIRDSDNWGAWFVSGIPAPNGWVFEVPSGYDTANKGAIFAQGMYGTPLPTAGMNDVTVFTSNSLKLGQVIGALTPNTIYYIDSACGIDNENYIMDTNWPEPSPALHIELWRIPAGVTDGSVIYSAIAANNPSYVKVAQETAPATGDIMGESAMWHTVASKWQIIGMQYKATSADTHMYVRVYGSGGADVNGIHNDGTGPVKPQYAFSDVYLSTQKRLVPGGLNAFNISNGMLGDDYSHVNANHVQKYEVLGPYNCIHAVRMGVNKGDVNGDCRINLFELAAMAEDWLKPLFTDITGAVPE